MRAHPPLFEVVRRLFVCKDVDEVLTSEFKRPCDLCHEELVILHVLEEFDRDHPIECTRLKLVGNHVASDDFQI